MKHLLIFLVILLSFMSFKGIIMAKKTDILISNLYNQINQDLLLLKKEQPQTQPKVYSLLDQVCKMYTATKTSIEKRAKTKNKLKIKIKESTILKYENNALKENIIKLKTKFISMQKELAGKNKTLTENIDLLNNINKEKELIQNKANELEKQKNELILNQQKNITGNNDNNNEFKLPNNQSLNLTSTSAPSSSL